MQNKFLILVFILFFTGCSTKIFMSYEEQALCNLGQGAGYCGSVSEVYEVTIKEK